MHKAYTAEGNLGLLMNLKKIFNTVLSAKTEETIFNKEQPPPVKQATEDTNQRFTTGKEGGMKVLALNSSPRGEGQSKRKKSKK